MARGEAPAGERPVLIDSSIWIEALDPGGDPACRVSLDRHIAAQRAATCEVVIAEVLRGVDDERTAAILEGRLRATKVLSSHGSGTIAALMGRRMGAPRQRLADLLIAAAAWQHGAALLHRDRHLAQIAQHFRIPQTEA